MTVAGRSWLRTCKTQLMHWQNEKCCQVTKTHSNVPLCSCLPDKVRNTSAWAASCTNKNRLFGVRSIAAPKFLFHTLVVTCGSYSTANRARRKKQQSGLRKLRSPNQPCS